MTMWWMTWRTPVNFEVASPHRRDLLLADRYVGGDVVEPIGRGAS